MQIMFHSITGTLYSQYMNQSKKDPFLQKVEVHKPLIDMV
jgi:hypothetical protein